jgi:hypothetical protein
MPMTEMQVGDQTIRYDRDRTAVAYRTLEHGFAEKCGCMFCKNFATQRNLVYPDSFRALLEQLGIDPNKEAEAFEYGPVEDGCRLCGGWREKLQRSRLPPFRLLAYIHWSQFARVSRRTAAHSGVHDSPQMVAWGGVPEWRVAGEDACPTD